MLITFSGLDGAGKSTLISILKDSLDRQGRKTVVLTMYDHVGLYAGIRFLRDATAGLLNRLMGWVPKERVVTNDPDRIDVPLAERGRVMTGVYELVRSAWVKQFVCLADIFIFQFYRFYFEHIRRRILIMDRYFFDSLADVADGRHWNYVRAMLKALSMPDLSIFVNVVPEVAFARKGEYSVEYLQFRLAKYRQIFEWIPGSVVLANDDPRLAREKLIAIVKQRMNGQWQR